MNPKNEKNLNEFSFSKPAVYQIKVKGDLAKSITDQLSGMQLTVERKKGGHPVSVLIGRISDQTALIGILNTLYELHLPVISVKVLNESGD